MMYVKIHTAYRKTVAVCDVELLGKIFEEGQIQLDVKKDFYEGEQKNEGEVIEILKEAKKEDVTFSLVGNESISCALKAGIIEEEGIMKVQNVPHALSLL